MGRVRTGKLGACAAALVLPGGLAVAQAPEQGGAVEVPQVLPVPDNPRPVEARPVEAQPVLEPPVISPEELEALVRDLGAADVAKRREATMHLSQRGDVRLKDLEPILKRRDLSHEQRRRLLAAAEQRFYREPRAALGFSAVVGPAAEGVRGVSIMRVEEGFPASGKLKDGDRIISVNGISLPNFEAIRPIIVSHDPGDALELVVVRDGANVEITAELGSFNMLNSRPDEGVLAAAWQRRSRGLRGDEADPIASGLAPAMWAVPEFEHSEEGFIGVVMGGEPRGGLLSGADAFHIGHLGRVDVDDLRRREQMRAQLAIQLTHVNRELADPNLPRERRQELLRLHATLEQTLARHDAMINRIRRELAQPVPDR